MKRYLLFFIIMLIAASSFGQSHKKPIMMVIPDDGWCHRNGVVDELGNPDYQRAVQIEEMDQLIVAMGDIMAEVDPGYEFKLLKNALKNLKDEEGRETVLKSKGGGEMVESDLDKLTRSAKADILITLSYELKRYGSRNRVEFTVTGLDAYTSKQISGDVGASSASSAPLPMLLREAALGFMDNFCFKLNRHFEVLNREGREGVVIFKMAEDCPYTFDSEVYLNGESGELSDAIAYWFNLNTVNGAFSLSDVTDNRMEFEQVRFPMFGNGFGGVPQALDMRGFMKPISKFLEQFGISCKINPVGLGKVYIVLGGLNRY